MSINSETTPSATRRASSVWSTLAWAIGSFIVGVGVFIAVATLIQHSTTPVPTIIAATPTPSAPAPETPSTPSVTPEPDSSGATAACAGYAQALATDLSNGVDPLVTALHDAALQTADQRLRDLILAVSDSYASNDLNPDTLTAVSTYCLTVQ